MTASRRVDSKIDRNDSDDFTLGINVRGQPSANVVDRADESPEQLFQRTLQMDPGIARMFTAAGIVTIEELAYVPMQELLDVPGLKEADAQLFRKRAHAYLLKDVMRGHDDGGAVDA